MSTLKGGEGGKRVPERGRPGSGGAVPQLGSSHHPRLQSKAGALLPDVLRGSTPLKAGGRLGKPLSLSLLSGVVDLKSWEHEPFSPPHPLTPSAGWAKVHTWSRLRRHARFLLGFTHPSYLYLFPPFLLVLSISHF